MSGSTANTGDNTGRAPEAEARDRMLAGLPVTARTIDIDGIATSVLEGGDGPQLVLLDGGIECGGAMWAPVLSRLMEHHRVVVPDVPGLGQSAPATRLDTDTFVSWFEGLLKRTNLEQPTLVAHSLIGTLATRLATRERGLLGQLVVYAAPGIGPYRMPMRLRYVAIRFAIRPTVRNAERFEDFALLDRAATRRLDPDWFDAFSAYTMARASVPHVKTTMRRLVATETKPIPDAELSRIDVPTSLLWGRHDLMAPLGLAEAAARRHAWPLHVIDDAAHAPHIEQPDAFVESLAAAMHERRAL